MSTLPTVAPKKRFTDPDEMRVTEQIVGVEGIFWKTILEEADAPCT